MNVLGPPCMDTRGVFDVCAYYDTRSHLPPEPITDNTLRVQVPLSIRTPVDATK